MKNILSSLNRKARSLWSRIKGWVYSILIALGLAAPLVLAETVNFTYTRATTNVDGTPLALEDIAFTRLYCDGTMVVEEPGADQDFSYDLGVGSHDCYATHVHVNGEESDPSNIVTKVVQPKVPMPPENFSL